MTIEDSQIPENILKRIKKMDEDEQMRRKKSTNS